MCKSYVSPVVKVGTKRGRGEGEDERGSNLREETRDKRSAARRKERKRKSEQRKKRGAPPVASRF